MPNKKRDMIIQVVPLDMDMSGQWIQELQRQGYQILDGGLQVRIGTHPYRLPTGQSAVILYRLAER